MKIDDIELSDCPFCGSDNLSVYEDVYGALVECWGCEARGPDVKIEAEWTYAMCRELAMHGWNCRGSFHNVVKLFRHLKGHDPLDRVRLESMLGSVKEVL